MPNIRIPILSPLSTRRHIALPCAALTLSLSRRPATRCKHNHPSLLLRSSQHATPSYLPSAQVCTHPLVVVAARPRTAPTDP